MRTTTDQRDALAGADFVVVTISTGGFASMRHDLEVPERYGIRQSVGDTVGPGGISRALRNIPVLLGHRPRHGGRVPGRVAAQHHEPDDVPDASGGAGDVDQDGSGCATRSATSRPSSGGRAACGRRRRRGDRGREPPAADHVADGRRGRRVRTCHRPVDLGAAGSPTSTLKVALYERCGVLPGAGDRHVAEFFPAFLTEESGWGKHGASSSPTSPSASCSRTRSADALARHGVRREAVAVAAVGRDGGAGDRVAPRRASPNVAAQPAEHGAGARPARRRGGGDDVRRRRRRAFAGPRRGQRPAGGDRVATPARRRAGARRRGGHHRRPGRWRGTRSTSTRSPVASTTGRSTPWPTSCSRPPPSGCRI